MALDRQLAEVRFVTVAEVASLAHTPLGDMSHFDNETLLDHLIDYLIGGLRAPSHTRT